MTAERPTGRIRYIPALDGIRGLLLPGVILVHYALFLGGRPGLPSWLHHVGMFTLNIQMFFVLSGALITSLLVAEHQNTGSASLTQFYLRRSRRLLPALATVLPLMLLAELAWTGTRSSSPLGSHPWLALVAVSLFVGNWVLFRITGGIGWLGPAWTLGIEEQFYLTWPILLRFGLKRRVRREVVLSAFAVAAVLSIAFATFLNHRYGSARTYYATPTQLPSIVVGCALGYELTSNPLGRLAALLRYRLVGAIGFVGTVAASVLLADHDRYIYRGGYLVYALVACLLVGHCFVSAGNETVVTRILGWRPFMVMGQISYEAYLIHVIVIIAVADALPHLHVYPMIVLDSVIVAALSLSFYYLVEQPIRRDGWRKFFAGVRRPIPAVRVAYARRPFAVAGGLLTAAGAVVAVGLVAATSIGAGSGPGVSGGGTAVAAQAGAAAAVAPGAVNSAAPGGQSKPGSTDAVAPGAASTSAASAGVLQSAAPVLVAVRPAAGPLVGGEAVTVTGHHLGSVGQVLFGSAPARSFQVMSATRIRAVAPARPQAGNVPITLVARHGSASAACVTGCAVRFSYLAVPTITGLTPPVGVFAGGTAITIHGSGFAPGVKVMFGALRLSDVRRMNGSTLVVTAPPARLVGLAKSLAHMKRLPVAVTVRTAGGTSEAGPLSRFTYV